MTASRLTRARIVIGVIAVIFLLGAPQVLAVFAVINLPTVIAYAVLALSLGLVWGYGGILCFGQTAFFGVGAYAYVIAAINLGGTTGAIPLAIIVAAGFAAILGYFMFYGRVSDVYLAVITLTVTLILFNLMRRTSGPEFKIGNALLGGFNGVAAPPMNLPGDTSTLLSPESVFYVSMVVLILAYFFCVWLTRTHFGRVIVAIRENELRAELLGYDIRLYKLALFSIGGAIAGVAGIIFAANGLVRVTPEMFNLSNTALTIVWVIIGGRGTLIGPILGAFALFYLTRELGTQLSINPNLTLGLILVLFVLFVPSGIVPGVVKLWDASRARRSLVRKERRMRRRRHRRPATEATHGG